MGSSTFQIIPQHFSILYVINTSKCWCLQVIFKVEEDDEEGGSGLFWVTWRLCVWRLLIGWWLKLDGRKQFYYTLISFFIIIFHQSKRQDHLYLRLWLGCEYERCCTLYGGGRLTCIVEYTGGSQSGGCTCASCVSACDSSSSDTGTTNTDGGWGRLGEQSPVRFLFFFTHW